VEDGIGLDLVDDAGEGLGVQQVGPAHSVY